MSGFDMDTDFGATKGATMGHSASYVPSAAIKTEAVAMDPGKDTGKVAMGVATDQAICKQTPCLPFQHNADGSTTTCENFRPDLCYTDVGYEGFYTGINFGILKRNAERYFEEFGPYCWDWFDANPGAMDLFRSVYQGYTYTRTMGKYGMFSEIKNLVKPEVDLCKDINYSFAIPLGNSTKLVPLRIFHIALHSPKPKLVEIDRSRRDTSEANCAFFPRHLNSDGRPVAGSGAGAFHYKIDSLCSTPPSIIPSNTNCNTDLFLNEEKAPFKQFYYDRDIGFQPNDNPFENTKPALDALNDPKCKICTLSAGKNLDGTR